MTDINGGKKENGYICQEVTFTNAPDIDRKDVGWVCQYAFNTHLKYLLDDILGIASGLFGVDCNVCVITAYQRSSRNIMFSVMSDCQSFCQSVCSPVEDGHVQTC